MENFASNLHRLRKLLGRNDTVILQNGMLALDKHLCWVDARAFEYHLNRAEALWKSSITDSELDELSKCAYLLLSNSTGGNLSRMNNGFLM